jgi:hypothetical protein
MQYNQIRKALNTIEHCGTTIAFAEEWEFSIEMMNLL